MLVVLRSKTSLGTGGVLRNAADLVESLMSLVINGDSYIDVDLGAFLASHREWEADDSLVGAPADGRAHCGMSPLPKTARCRLRSKARWSISLVEPRALRHSASGRCLWKRSFFADGWPKVDPFHVPGQMLRHRHTRALSKRTQRFACRRDRSRSAATRGRLVKVTITGAAGFIGTAPYEVLLGSRLPGAWFRYP